MLNLKKISQAMLIACGLAVASFYIAPSYAADEQTSAINSAYSDYKKKKSAVGTAQTNLTTTKQVISGRKQEYEAQRNNAKDTYKGTIKEEDRKVTEAETAYKNCSGDDCSKLYQKLQETKSQAKKAKETAKTTRDNTIKQANKDEKNDAVLKSDSEESKAVQQAKKDLNQSKKDARKAERELKNAEKAAEKDVKSAEKEMAKAQKDIDKYCSGDKPDGSKCSAARKQSAEAATKMNKAKADLGTYQEEARQIAADALLSGVDEIGKELEQDYDSQLAAMTSENQEQQKQWNKQDEDAKIKTDAEEANNKYNQAVDKYKDAANDLAKVQAQCQGDDSKECKDKIAAAEEALGTAKTAADNAYNAKAAADKKFAENLDAKKTNVNELTTKRSKTEQELDKLQSEYAQAKAACDYYNDEKKEFKSAQAKAEKEKNCNAAASLKQQIADKEDELDKLKAQEEAAQKELTAAYATSADHEGKEYMAFTNDSGGVNYANADDVFKTITRRAAYILVGLKPIVYTFAGFGLIAFAYMAIFNKISWKWFGNIAIGLFLVANMGRLIEYAVFPSTKDGELNDGKLDSFGDYLHNALNDSEYMWVEPVTPYTPTAALEKQGSDTPDTTVNAPDENKEKENEKALRKFCGKADGATGWGNFTNCVKDVVSAGKKAVAAARKVQDTVHTVTNAVSSSMNAVNNIVGAAKSIGKGNLEDSIKALGRIGQNVNNIVGIAGGTMGQVMNNATGFRNDLQDVTKSTDEQRDLQGRRDRGEATNKMNAKLMGQVLDKDGNVERLFGGVDKDGNAIAGDIASNRKQGVLRDHNGEIIFERDAKGEIKKDENGNPVMKTGFQTPDGIGFMEGIDRVVKRTGEVNEQFQGAVNVASDGIGLIGNARVGQINGPDGQNLYDGSKTLNNLYQEKQQEKRDDKAAADKLAKDIAGSGLVGASDSSAVASAATTPEVTSAIKRAAQDVADYNKLKSEATSAADKAKSLDNAAQNAQKKADDAAAKCAATQMKSDCMKAAQAKSEAEKAARKAQEAKETAAEVGAKAAEAEKAAHESTVAATAEARDSAEAKMKSEQKALDDAKQALKDAQASGDESAIRAAKTALNQQQDAYDKAESAYYQAAVKYEELTEDKEERKSIEQALSKDYKNMDSVQEAKKAETEYNQAKNAANNAESNAKRLDDAAQNAQKKANEAASKCAITKMASDCNAANLSKLEADQAARKAQEAKETAVEAKSKAAEAEKAAHDSAVSAAAEVITKAKTDMDNASQKVDAAKEALAEAQKSGDADAIKKAKEFLSTQQDAYDSVAKAYYKASEAHASLVEDAASRQAANNKYAEAQNDAKNAKDAAVSEAERQARAKQEAEEARRNYQASNSPEKVAQAAQEQLNKARNEASKAANYAQEREKVAQKAADLAKAAAEKAKNSGDPVDQAKAEELQKRAELAKSEAAEAKTAAAEAQKPIADLQQKSKDAQVKKLEVDQKKHKQAIETAETEMKNVRSKIADAQAQAKTLLDQVEKLAQEAEKDPSNDNAVAAASQAYKVYQAAQQEINKLQKELDETIRQKSAAENSYFSTVSQLENLTK